MIGSTDIGSEHSFRTLHNTIDPNSSRYNFVFGTQKIRVTHFYVRLNIESPCWPIVMTGIDQFFDAEITDNFRSRNKVSEPVFVV